MTPEQIRMYDRLCAADPTLRCEYCTTAYLKGLFGHGSSGGEYGKFAIAAITDHLHTRLDEEHSRSKTVLYCEMDGGGWWAIRLPIKSGGPVVDVYKDKLTAYLTAHAVRLGVERE